MEQTLVAAHALFAERGYAAVTMDEVAAAVGVTKPLLYNYFGNKERLYIACMERAGDALTATVAEAVGDSAQPGRGARAPASAPSSPSSTADRAAWAVLFDETLPRGGEVADRVADYRGASSSSSPARCWPASRQATRRRPDRSRGPLRRPARRRRGAGALVAADRGDHRRRGRRAADLDDRARPAPRSTPVCQHLPNQRKGDRMNSKTRRVAVVGGNRIPFARSNSVYAHASNQDMLTAALDGLIDRFGLDGETARRGRRRRRAQALPRPRPRPRERAQHPPRPGDPRLRRPAGLRHRPGDDDPGRQQDRPRPDRLRHRLRRRHHLRRADRAQRAAARDAARRQPPALDRRQAARPDQRPPRPHRARDPPQRGAAHRPLDGRALRDHGRPNGRSAGPSRTSSPSPATRTSPPPTSAASSTTCSPPTSGLERDQNLRPDSNLEKLAKLKPVFGGPEGTMTAANSTPLSDGASAVLLACEEWAKERGLPILAYITEAQTAAVDHVHKREGLLMAPAYAMPTMLDRAGLETRRLRLLRDPRGLRRPGALHAEGLGGRRVLQGEARAATSRSARSTARSSTSTAARWPPPTRSPRPAGASSPASPSSCTKTAKAAA